MTLAEARSEFADRGFGYLSTTRQNLLLNRAATDFNDLSAWPWLEITSTGTGTVPISDLRDIISVLDLTNNQELEAIDVSDLPSVDPLYATTTGTPANYWLDNDTVTPYPSSSISLSVRYIRVPADLSNDDEEPAFPTRYATTWIDLAVIRAYQDRDNFDAANALQAQVDRDIQRLQENLIWRTMDHPPQQRVVSPQNC